MDRYAGTGPGAGEGQGETNDGEEGRWQKTVSPEDWGGSWRSLTQHKKMTHRCGVEGEKKEVVELKSTTIIPVKATGGILMTQTP